MKEERENSNADGHHADRAKNVVRSGCAFQVQGVKGTDLEVGVSATLMPKRREGSEKSVQGTRSSKRKVARSVK